MIRFVIVPSSRHHPDARICAMPTPETASAWTTVFVGGHCKSHGRTIACLLPPLGRVSSAAAKRPGLAPYLRVMDRLSVRGGPLSLASASFGATDFARHDSPA